MTTESPNSGWQPMETAPKDRPVDLWLIPTKSWAAESGAKAHRAEDYRWSEQWAGWISGSGVPFASGLYKATQWMERQVQREVA